MIGLRHLPGKTISISTPHHPHTHLSSILLSSLVNYLAVWKRHPRTMYFLRLYINVFLKTRDKNSQHGYIHGWGPAGPCFIVKCRFTANTVLNSSYIANMCHSGPNCPDTGQSQSSDVCRCVWGVAGFCSIAGCVEHDWHQARSS